MRTFYFTNASYTTKGHGGVLAVVGKLHKFTLFVRGCLRITWSTYHAYRRIAVKCLCII